VVAPNLSALRRIVRAAVFLLLIPLWFTVIRETFVFVMALSQAPDRVAYVAGRLIAAAVIVAILHWFHRSLKLADDPVDPQ